ncbi:MAG: GAF domain-containing protein [Pseudonocardiales bacterium]|nr:GAF domain-containing protein [Pseudonocardiales bacterium]
MSSSKEAAPLADLRLSPANDAAPTKDLGTRRDGGLAQARERFLTSEPVKTGVVRDTILASWNRSRDWQVATDCLELPFKPNFDRKSRLASCADGPISAAYAQHADEPISIILTDAAGVVLDRRTGDSRLQHKLDKVWLAPGFSYAEQFAGTNGIGTTLEGGAPAHVFGHEHYVEHLEDLACAGAPIRHPTTGKVLGILDLTCWRTDANPAMIAAASSIAAQIEEALLAQIGRRELALLHDYLLACRRNRGCVLAISTDLLMMNDSARELIDPQDQVVLLGQAAEALAGGKTRVFHTSLPSGATARISCKPCWSESAPIGGIVQVQLLASEPATCSADRGTTARSHTMPGVVGSSMPWVRCCTMVQAHLRAGEWVDLAGEVGVGKLTVAAGVHRAGAPGAHLRVLDADDCTSAEQWLNVVADELALRAGTLVLRHVDRLPADVLQALAELLAAARRNAHSPRSWVVATRSSSVPRSDELDNLIGCFSCSVQVPPLRHHIEDLPELVRVLTARLTRGARLSCSAEAMRLLMRNRWPGNVEQLCEMLRKIVAHRRTGVIEVADLPADALATARRVLSPLESIERDAVVEALINSAGNRVEAARHLGMSRATIYRKIRYYGITVSHRSSRS